MEFIFSLTHFCEVHGPKSVLCTQALPIRCQQCEPRSPPLRSRGSNDSFDTEASTAGQTPATDGSEQLDIADSSRIGLSRSTTAIGSVPPTPSIEQSPYYVKIGLSDPLRIAGSATNTSQNDTCASCTFSVPDEITKQLPAGAPGSPKANGPGLNGSPILRTRQIAPSCTFEKLWSSTFTAPEDQCSHSHRSGSSANSGSEHSSPPSEASETSCHPHEINYFTVRTPTDPTEYAILRASVIRTLSSEMLPRGLSSGPIVVGDSTNGFTIAHVFRLPDPKARGRRRSYAFLALAGHDGQRAFRAFSIIEAAFQRLADKLIRSAERHQEEQRQQEEEANQVGRQNRKYTPVSSFLTQRVVDADGLPRRVGQTVPRSLAEITGNPRIFAEIHAEFCLTLFVLGSRLKMLPRNEVMTYETLITNDEGRHRAFRSRVDQRNANGLGLRAVPAASSVPVEKLRDLDATPTPARPEPSVEITLSKMTVGASNNASPLPTSTQPPTNDSCTSLGMEAARKQVMV